MDGKNGVKLEETEYMGRYFEPLYLLISKKATVILIKNRKWERKLDSNVNLSLLKYYLDGWLWLLKII